MTKIAKKYLSFKEQLKRTLIFYSLLPLFLVAIVSYVFIYYLNYIAIINNNKESLNYIYSTLNKEFRDIENRVNLLISNEDIIEGLKNKNFDSRNYEEIYKIRNSLYFYGNIFIIDENKNLILTLEKNGVIESIYKNVELLDKEKIYYQNIKVGNKPFSIVGKKIDINENDLGYIFFYFDDEEYYKVLGNSENQIYITDRYGNILISNANKFINSLGKIDRNFRDKERELLVEKNRYYFSKKRLEYFDFELYNITFIGYLVENFIKNCIYLSIIFTLLILLIYKVANKLAEKKTIYLNEIINVIENIRIGNFDRKIYIHSNDEFEVIGNTFNSMMKNIKVLMEKNVEESRHSVISEIKQMESYFNPHFLFNSLELLKYSIHLDKKITNKIIVNMSSILRYSIETKTSEASVKKEIYYITSYLEIQKLRFGQRFNYRIESSQEIDMLYIPKLIFQPVVENSLKYSKSNNDIMEIKVSFKIKEDRLKIKIYDNGAGIEKEQLKALKIKLERKNLEVGEHLGLYTIQRRIKLMYGNNYGINIRSRYGGGTIVTLNLPIRGEKNDKNSYS